MITDTHLDTPSTGYFRQLEQTERDVTSVQRHNAMNHFLSSVEKRAFRMADIATRNRDDALEIVQETMLGLQRYIERPENEWKPLFYSILQRRINDWHRHNMVRNKVIATVQWLKGKQEPVDPIDTAQAQSSCQPLQRLEGELSTHAIIDALKSLPARQQQAFMLRGWEGFSVKETASIMSCSEGSIKTHYSRAVHSMRGQLEAFKP